MVKKFSKTGNQVEKLRRCLPLHSLLIVYVRHCQVMEMVCWYVLCGLHNVLVFISGILFVCFWLRQHFKIQISYIKLWNFALSLKKNAINSGCTFSHSRNYVDMLWVVVFYQQWSLIIFHQDLIFFSSIWAEFLGRNVAAPNKDYISQCPLQLERDTSLFWPMGLGKVGNLITWHLLLHAGYAVYTLNTYLLNELMNLW